MATRAAAMSQRQEGSVIVVTWAGLTKATDDVGAAVIPAAYRFATWQVSGTFGTGGAVTIKGSNDGTNFLAMTFEPTGDPGLLDTSTRLGMTLEKPLQVRPEVTAGDSATDLTVTLVLSGYQG